MKLIKFILGSILLYIGGKMVYKVIKPEEEVVERTITEVKQKFKSLDDIDF